MEATSIAAEREMVAERTSGQGNAPLVKEARAYGAGDPQARLSPLTIRRREVRAQDVEIEIAFCGVCHSDIHTARGEQRFKD